MNGKYKGIGGKSVAGLLLCLMGVLTACEDDFGKNGTNSGVLTMKVAVPEGWTSGVAVDEEAPDSRCVSVDAAASESSIPLYLHTIESDNAVAVPATRGELKKEVEKFSMSAICYEEGGVDISELTPNFAYDLTCTVKGEGENKTASCPKSLLWPANGKVRFFAFAPVEDSSKPFTLSGATVAGAPTITYTVPEDITTQHDLMAACTDATSANVTLNFRHILTAVKVVTAKNMIPGKITEVTFSGIPNKGTYTPSTDAAKDNWKIDETSKGIYTVQPNVTIEGDYTIDDELNIDIKDKDNREKQEVIDGNLTLLMIPQTLPDEAKLVVKFKEALSGHEFTLSADLKDKEWPAGKIVTYSISPSSIHIKASVGINKKGVTDENPTGDLMPYSGVWYDVEYKRVVEIVQAGVETKKIDIPFDKIKFKYQLDGSDEDDCTTNADGLLQIAPQPAYETMRLPFGDKTKTETGSEGSPISLTVNNKTANCYLVDEAGYFSLPLVYGNGNVADPKANKKSLVYYPGYDDERMPADGKITDASDAVLCWQDAPDLIDPASVKVVNGNLVFHIRKQTLTQGNALLAVRNASKEIIWSWHIWVTPHKTEFYNSSKFYKSIIGDYSYELAQYNLGWCDRHAHNDSRKFSLRAVVDMSAYGGATDTSVEIGTFTQDVFKGSDAGDNTYYQWGRKDPMLGGIYNEKTPCYTYKKHGTSKDDVEFTMENKQVFNQYNDGKDCNYSFCKNPGDMIESSGEASKGVTIGYTIQHPYMFVTNSKEHIDPLTTYDPETGNYDPETGKGYDPKTGRGFNFRNHWHIPYVIKNVNYLNTETHIMFSAWNSAAADAGYDYTKPPLGDLVNNAEPVTKSVYDPCPPEFQVPPIHALKGVLNAMSSNDALSYLNSDNAWTITDAGGSITFPKTGVRNYALRPTEWKTVTGLSVTHEDFYKISMPAFQMLTFVSSATIVEKDPWNAYQVYIFYIDSRKTPKANLTPSSNSYGLSVRPMHYTESNSK